MLTLRALALVSIFSAAVAAETYTVSFSQDSGYVGTSPARTVLFGPGMTSSPALSYEVPLPFTFDFFGQPQSTIHIGWDGYLAFTPTPFQPWLNELPSTGGPQGVIAPWWDNHQLPSYGFPAYLAYEHRVLAFGSQEEFVVEWSNVTRSSETSVNHARRTFKVVLHYPSMDISFHYGDAGQVGTPQPESASVGLESLDGTRGITPVAGGDAITWGDVIREDVALFFRPRSVSQPYDLSIDWAGYSELGAGRTILWDGAVGTYDELQEIVVLGWQFPYFGGSYSSVAVTTEGMLYVGSATGLIGQNQAIPDAAAPDGVIAPLWDNLAVKNLGTTDEVSYERQGTSPNRKLVVEWRGVSRAVDTPLNYHFLSFQAHLYESGDIEFHYGFCGKIGTPPSALSATVGVEDSFGSKAMVQVEGTPVVDLDHMPRVGTQLRLTAGSDLLCGDCNGDGAVSILDALQAARYATATTPVIFTEDFARCNVAGTPGTGAGTTVDILDALSIAQRDVGLLASLSCAP